jgi:hypothetical protein
MQFRTASALNARRSDIPVVTQLTTQIQVLSDENSSRNNLGFMGEGSENFKSIFKEPKSQPNAIGHYISNLMHKKSEESGGLVFDEELEKSNYKGRIPTMCGDYP